MMVTKNAQKPEEQNQTPAAPGEAWSGKDDDAEEQLRALFADRLGQILDRRVNSIRGGRGRVGDFASFFGIHYTTAQRLLAGDSLPPVALLVKIADALQVPETWLLGRDETYDIDQKLANSEIGIARYSPAEPGHMQVQVKVPIAELPQGFDSSRLVYARAMGRNAVTQTVIVKVLLEPVDQVIHLVYYPQTSTVCLRRLQVVPSVGKVFLHPGDGGDSEVFKMEDLVFGDTAAEASGKITVVGPVVASLSLGYDFVS